MCQGDNYPLGNVAPVKFTEQLHLAMIYHLFVFNVKYIHVYIKISKYIKQIKSDWRQVKTHQNITQTQQQM